MDTQKYSNFFDNVDGSASRCKVRIRWYGDMLSEIKKPVLEFKIRHGFLGEKKQFILKQFSIDSLSIVKIRKIFGDSELPLLEKAKLENLILTLANRYRLKYFESYDRRFRITLDSQICFWKIDQNENLFLNKKTNDQQIVVELKYEKLHDQEAISISNYFPFRMTKSSKYVDGVFLLNDHFPQ
jgi:hypothetical protein